MKTFSAVRAACAIIVALTTPTQGFAAQWVTDITVTQAVVGNSLGEYTQLITSGAIANPASCPSADSYIVHDPALVRSALAIGLAAIAAGRPIRVFVTDTCDAATGRPLVSSIGLM